MKLVIQSIDLSKNRFDTLKKESVIFLSTKKLNMSENPNFNLEFSSVEEMLTYCGSWCVQSYNNTDLIFPNVKVLDLSFTRFGDNDFQELYRFPNLVEIYLQQSEHDL